MDRLSMIRARARALKESNYHAFRVWLKVYLQMVTEPDERPLEPSERTPDLLHNRSNWTKVAAVYSIHWKYPDLILYDIRKQIYTKYGLQGKMSLRRDNRGQLRKPKKKSTRYCRT